MTRWATFVAPGEHAPRAGVVEGDGGGEVRALRPGVALLDLLPDPERLAGAAESARRNPDAVFDLAAVRLRPPVPEPPSVRDFYAFERHVRTARERRGLPMEPAWYEQPVFYFSNPAALLGDGDDVAAPPGCAELDFELEVAAIVGREGRDLDPATAEAHVAGYCILDDWSARDLQRREMAVGLGPAKGKDFATSLGPFLVTPDELAPARSGKAYDLTMTAAVNGRECSRASLAEIHWSFGEMLAHASRGTRVRPGDVIGSGTCGGGCLLELTHLEPDAHRYLEPGDTVTLAVEALGTLTNRVVQGLRGPCRGGSRPRAIARQ